MIAKAILKQTRFQSLGTCLESEPVLLRKAWDFYSGVGVGKIGGVSIVQLLCRIYNIDPELVRATMFANQLTITFKAHKNPVEVRVVIGCVDRLDHPNFYRKNHHIITEGLRLVQHQYRQMVLEDGGGAKKRTYNIVDCMQTLAKKMRSQSHRNLPFETADCMKCFPNTSVAARTQPEEEDEELVPPISATVMPGEGRRQPLISDMFRPADSLDGSLYVKLDSSLSMLKKLLQEVLDHVSTKAGGGQAKMAVQGSRRGEPKWSFTVEGQGGGQGDRPTGLRVELTADQFLRLIVGSLNNQVVCFGKEVLRLREGTVEGQESSMLIQNLFFQSVVNLKVDDLVLEGDPDLARQFQLWIELFADDAASLGGVIGPLQHDLMRGQFQLEYEAHDEAVTYVGIEAHKCQMCDSGIETRPNMAKHGGNMFSDSMLDSWNQDNSPNASKLSRISASLISAYRLSSGPYPYLKAVDELMGQAMARAYPRDRVSKLIMDTTERLLSADPRPESPLGAHLAAPYAAYLRRFVAKLVGAHLAKGSVTRVKALAKTWSVVQKIRDKRLCSICFIEKVVVGTS